jgi:hypothetical protein
MLTLYAVLCSHRVNPSALCIFISLWHITVYCPLAHMVWHPTGIIRVLGVADFAGEAQFGIGWARRALHIEGGSTASKSGIHRIIIEQYSYSLHMPLSFTEYMSWNACLCIMCKMVWTLMRVGTI